MREISETERNFEMEADDWYASNRISKADDDEATRIEDEKTEIEVLREALQLLSQAHMRLVERVRLIEIAAHAGGNDGAER